MLSTLTTVEYIARACCPRVANNVDIMAALSAFVDRSTKAALIPAADIEHWSLVQRIVLRESFDSEDPFYKQWLYTMTMVRAAVCGRLDMIQLLTTRFPGCYVSLAVEEAASYGQLEVLKWLREHHD